ncbi:carbohydrate binding domain-containing protein [Barnesiella sp. An55]|uniref:carbohydrate binding domain-containing protein n=1 Tax=Barnesiella sp. An55 TaxID=1965646 RepID=UPI000B37B3B5|nr:carbohydrate binding domain-containing protein [Barnesiella sp. An55]OUN71165.1 hypothetical protein B5G10_09430 [Barnesiella sp. An55]
MKRIAATLVVGLLCLPLQAQEMELLYEESFDDATHYTDSVISGLPNGWAAVGATSFSAQPAIDYGKVADTGDKVIVSGYPQTSNRQDVAFSPMFEMKANTDYRIRVKYMMPGLSSRTSEMKITVGMGQDYENHLSYVYGDRDKAIDQWTLAEVIYTPSQDGQYCVGLWNSSTLSSSGDVYYDTFSIEEIASEPEPAWEATLPYKETFDDSTHYAVDAVLPNGWVSNTDNAFQTVNANEWGYVPNSGENLLVANPSYSSGRQDVTFTPMLEMEAGITYNVSFYLNLMELSRKPSFKFTVGNGQTVEAQTTVLKSYEDTSTSGWEKVEVAFTPTETGEYCFAFWACSALSMDGFMLIDDFEIASDEIVEPGWTPSIPYIETFDGDHYDGVSYLPIGWLATGDEPFITASLRSKPALSGSYYLVAPSSALGERHDIAYTPMMEMEAGVEYTASFYLYLPGGDNPATFRFTVGREQAYDMQDELYSVTDRFMTDWELVTVTYTPETTGEYCFAFWANSELASDGYYCIEDFSLRKSSDVLPPTGTIYMSTTLNSLIDGRPLLFPGMPYKMINQVDGADSYEWSVTGTAQVADPTAREPYVSFTQSGSYTIKLVATNKGGSSEFTCSLSCTVIDEGGFPTGAVSTVNDALDKVYQQADLPAYREDGSVQTQDTYEVLFHYVAGVNRYYRAIAERFEMPIDQKVEVSSVTFNLMAYGIYINTGQEDDSDKNVKLVFYPEKDGKPDLEHPFYEETANIVDKFGDMGIYLSKRIGWTLATPAELTGTFYVALEFDELMMDLDKEWTVGSFFGGDTRVHANGQTTLYVKPDVAIEGSDFVPDGEYCRADLFSPELKGYSFAVMPWIEMKEISAVSATESSVRFYASVDGSTLKVDGLNAGDVVNIYSMSGTLMASVKADDTTMYLPIADWAKGVYIIATNSRSVKFVK